MKKLQENSNFSEYKPLLTEMVCSDVSDENSLSECWTNAINRGGLIKITPYQVFLAIECCVRR